MPADKFESQQASETKLTNGSLINYLHEQLIENNPTGHSDDEIRQDILLEKTSVFSVFVPLMEVAKGDCVLPIFYNQFQSQSYLAHLKRHAAFFNKRGMTYFLATDSRMMTDNQWENLRIICQNIKVSLFDLKTIMIEDPKEIIKKFETLSYASKGEYIDYAKVALMNLAGRNPYNNIFIIDPDIIFSPETPLSINKSNTIAFTYTKRHSTIASGYDIENSMIYVDSTRPVFNDVEGEKDLVEKLLGDIERLLQSKSGLSSKHACYVFTLSTHDPVLLQNNRNDLSLKQPWDTAYTRPFIGNQRTYFVNKLVSKGDFMLHGRYSSINLQTWRKDSQSLFLNFEESILQSKTSHEAQELLIPSIYQLIEFLQLLPKNAEKFEARYYEDLKNIISINTVIEVLKRNQSKDLSYPNEYKGAIELARLPMVCTMIGSLGYSYYQNTNGWIPLARLISHNNPDLGGRAWDEEIVKKVFKNLNDILTYYKYKHFLPVNLFDAVDKEIISNIEDFLALTKNCKFWAIIFMDKHFDYTLSLFEGNNDKLELLDFSPDLQCRITNGLDNKRIKDAPLIPPLYPNSLFFKRKLCELEEGSESGPLSRLGKI
jgi:hypothetical protein